MYQTDKIPCNNDACSSTRLDLFRVDEDGAGVQYDAKSAQNRSPYVHKSVNPWIPSGYEAHRSD